LHEGVAELFAEASGKASVEILTSGLNWRSTAAGIARLREWERLNPEKAMETRRAAFRKFSRTTAYKQWRAAYYARRKDAINARRRARRAAKAA
jgi:hypothetical protein